MLLFLEDVLARVCAMLWYLPMGDLARFGREEVYIVTFTTKRRDDLDAPVVEFCSIPVG